MKGKVVRREETGSKMRVSMYDLFCQQFDGVSFDVFNRDLERKNWVLLLQNENGVLCGFSSMDIYDVDVDGQTIAVVYSGDTVVDSETWSDSALSYYWMGAIDYLRRLYRRERLYWFLLVSGYRTYTSATPTSDLTTDQLPVGHLCRRWAPAGNTCRRASQSCPPPMRNRGGCGGFSLGVSSLSSSSV